MSARRRVRTLEASVRLARACRRHAKSGSGRLRSGRCWRAWDASTTLRRTSCRAAQTIEALVDKLQTPSLRPQFLVAAPVVDIYHTLGHRPPSV